MLFTDPVVAENNDQQLQQVRQQIDVLNSNLSETRQAYTAAETQLANAERKIGEVSGSIRQLTTALTGYEQKIATFESKKALELQKLQLQQLQLADQVRSAYAMGRQDKVKILLNQQDPAVLERVMAYHDYLTRARIQQLAVIQQSIDQVDVYQALIQTEQQKAQLAIASRQQEQMALEQARSQRQQLLLTLKASWNDVDTKLKSLKASERELMAVINKINAEVVIPKAMEKAFGRMKGRLPWPVKGRLAIRYGAKKMAGLRWDGVLIQAKEGNDVRAIHRGRVAYADWLRGYGLLIILEHGDGYMTLYGHNESLLKDDGEWVEAGETIASVGRSGGNAHAGVYFGIRKKGSPRNPKKWCKKTRGKKVG